jgi:hypothetical protein
MSDEWRLEIKGAGAGADFLSGWSYRKSHELTGASGAGTNYQVKITVHYGAGSDSGDDVYLNSKSRTDFIDINFTDNTGTTELDFWRESKVDSDNAVFWIEIKDDLGTNQTIYIYYGKNDASDASSGDDTFAFFDDFPGTKIDDGDVWDGGEDTIFSGTHDGETSVVVEGNTAHCWTGAGASHQDLEYSYASDSKCAVYTQYAGNPIMTDIRFPDVIKEGSTYYLFAHRPSLDGGSIFGDVYLWSSTDKVTWNIMNGGNPVLTHSDNTSDWNYKIANVSVCVVDGVWHMMIEAADDTYPWNGVYTYSNLTDMNWNTNASIIHDTMSCPDLVFVSDRNSFMVFTPTGDDTLTSRAFYASLSDDLSLSASWHESSTFGFGDDKADMEFAVVGSAKDYNIIFQHYAQGGPNYQKYSNLSINEFFDMISSDAKWEGDTSAASVSGGIMTLTSPNATTYEIQGAVDIDDPYILESKMKYPAFTASSGAEHGFKTVDQAQPNRNWVEFLRLPDTTQVRVSKDDSMSNESVSFTLDTYKTFRIDWVSNSCKFYEENSSLSTLSTNCPTMSLAAYYALWNCNLLVDWVFCRKHAYPSPTNGDWSSEESTPTLTKFNTHVPFYLESKRQGKRINFANIQIPNRATPITQLGSTDVHTIRVTGRIKLGSGEDINDYEDGFTNVQWHTSTAAYRGEELYFYKVDDGTTSSRGTYHLVDYQIDETGGRKDWYSIRLNLVKHED